jgi:transcriptional regulator with XRE-family HTH domain
MKRVTARRPTLKDIHIGNRIRDIRKESGLSQKQLSDKLNVTYQQVQKYETGYNRVCASRLHDISLLMNVNINYFFEGI